MGLLCTIVSMPAQASYVPFNTNVNMNVGIGTSTPQAAFVVTMGIFGICTDSVGGSLIVAAGNVGIGTVVPGVQLDVWGTVRMTGLTVSGQTPSSGYASDSQRQQRRCDLVAGRRGQRLDALRAEYLQHQHW